jgi:hypothetical protein
MRRVTRVFGTRRFSGPWSVLSLDGHRVVDVASSRGKADALELLMADFERQDMRRQYFRLSHLVGSA